MLAVRAEREAVEREKQRPHRAAHHQGKETVTALWTRAQAFFTQAGSTVQRC
ncbi:hypothetical protein [Kitasatospora cathayae]|uniref:Transposase n=1 Tax=Kitasatospora cathayae TaxID=3004092 RepID=A0ABY7QEV1_9ACTN|nr:hypothetical protein [Kitasatospora sp. HUAS 3-15]WBP91220.1 hypothetical protein O1G21_38645 [Kitasatospora sp. HUAS 3-15]